MWKGLKKFDHIDCKNIAFEEKKSAFFSPYKTSSANFQSSALKTFVLHKVESLYIAIRNWVANPWKK
jgi:hypothetical protein